MKVAHFMPYPGIGGTEIAALRLMEAARRAGIESLVFCAKPTPVLRDFFTKHDISVIDWPAPTPSIRHGLRFYRESRRLAEDLKERTVDLVHCQDVGAGFYGSFAGRLAGLPVLCHVRNRHNQISRRDQLFLRPVSRFLFVSQSIWGQFSVSVPNGKGQVFYDGVAAQEPPADLPRLREEFYAQFHIPFDAILVGMTARIHPQKDYETFLRAAAEVVKEEQRAVFVFAGEHSKDESGRRYFADLNQLASDLGILNSIRFTGYRSDVNVLLHLFQIYAFSTNYEGFPLATLEAMACGKPVVATAVDGIPEQIRDGENGILVPHKDHRALAESLLSLMREPQRALALGAAARRDVETRFSNRAFSDNVASLYGKYLTKANGRA